MIIKEYRVILPLAYDEYALAHGYTTAEFTRQDIHLGDRIEVVENTPMNNLQLPDKPGFTLSGQYQHKIYHLKRQVPKWAKVLAPKDLLVFHEKMWNSFPFARAEFHNPGFLKEKLYLRLDSICMPDRGDSPNVHQLTPAQLSKREVIYLDIANDPVTPEEYSVQFDPRKYHSTKTDRGPLVGKWQDTANPVMCCYKLLVMDFKMLGLTDKVEKYASETERKLFQLFYRQMFCWTDKWYGLTVSEVQQLDTDVVKECNDSYAASKVKGLTGKSATTLPNSTSRK